MIFQICIMVETLSPSCGGRTGLDLLHYLKGEKASMGYSCLEMKSQNTSILPSLDGVNHRDRKETNMFFWAGGGIN
jgi:hypothetical protein